MEPFTLLAILAKVIGPVIKACKSVNEKWQNSKNLARDVMEARTLLNVQYYRLEEITTKRRSDRFEQPFNSQDENDERTRNIVNMLSRVKDIYESCDEMLNFFEEEYKQKKLQKKRRLEIKPEPEDATVKPSSPPESNSRLSVPEQAPSLTFAAQTPTSGSSEPRTSWSDASQMGVTHVAENETNSGPGPKRRKRDSIMPYVTFGFSRRRKKGKEKGKEVLILSNPSQPVPGVIKTPPSDSPGDQANAKSAKSKAIEEMIQHETGSLAGSAQDTKAREAEIQSQSTMEQHLAWIRKKDQLDKNVQRLTRLMDSLDTALQLRNPVLPVRSKQSAQMSSKLSGIVVETQKALDRLHRSLAARNMGGRWQFSLKLAEDFIEEGADFFDLCESYLELGSHREHAFYFGMQRHDRGERSQSTAFVLQTRREDRMRDQPPIRPSKLSTDLGQAQHYVDNPLDPPRDYDTWAAISVKEDLGQHWMFRDRQNLWLCCGSLLDKIAGGAPGQRMTRLQCVELSLIIVYSFLYLAHVRQTCGPISLANYKYYTKNIAAAAAASAGEGSEAAVSRHATDEWDEANPKLLSPFIDFGFGEPPTTISAVSFGNRRRKPVDNSMRLLGIALVQIGLCLPYSSNPAATTTATASTSSTTTTTPGTAAAATAATTANPAAAEARPADFQATNPSAVTDALQWAENFLPSVDARLCVSFSEVVADCLTYKSDPLPGQQSQNFTKQNEFLADQIVKLHEMKQELENTEAGTSVPIAVAV